MQSNAPHLKNVDIPEWIYAAQIHAQEERAIDEELITMDMLIKCYRVEVIRIILDLLVLGCGVLILCALSK